MKAIIHISLKHGVLDPQGKATLGALQHLGFDNVDAVRHGKTIELDITAQDATAAHEQVDAMCRKLLANTVIENYDITIEG